MKAVLLIVGLLLAIAIGVVLRWWLFHLGVPAWLL